MENITTHDFHRQRFNRILAHLGLYFRPKGIEQLQELGSPVGFHIIPHHPRRRFHFVRQLRKSVQREKRANELRSYREEYSIRRLFVIPGVMPLCVGKLRQQQVDSVIARESEKWCTYISLWPH